MPKTIEKPRGKGQPAAKILTPKNKAVAKASSLKPARTMQDWKNEEAAETDSQSHRGSVRGQLSTPEQAVVNDNYSIGNWSGPTWLDEDDNRLSVSFWFPSQRAAIDYPETEAEHRIKTALFKKLKVAYVGVLSGEPLKVEQARAQLKAQGAKISD